MNLILVFDKIAAYKGPFAIFVVKDKPSGSWEVGSVLIVSYPKFRTIMYGIFEVTIGALLVIVSLNL